MAKIVLDVNDENLGTVISILNNLKEGLITSIDINTRLKDSTERKVQKHTRYQPKTDRVIYEEEQASLKSMGKYLDPAEFKKRLRKR
ncbi:MULTISPECIES: hypothetical protein [Sulfurimonas]|uniref:hypothetical protein n=1 Tax=Sulfurimonas TaxID=202746 RepID=UPI001265165A|nr:hypothetical protein [Sulfurimonas indica]